MESQINSLSLLAKTARSAACCIKAHMNISLRFQYVTSPAEHQHTQETQIFRTYKKQALYFLSLVEGQNYFSGRRFSILRS